MENHDISGIGRPTEHPITGDSSNPCLLDHFQTQSQTVDAWENADAGQRQKPKQSLPAENYSKWDQAGVWIFIALVTLLSIFAGYRFWTKLAFPYPE